MKKNRLFCKLLSVISAVSMILFGNTFGGCVKAMNCEEVVKYLSSHSIPLAFGEEFWLFGKERVEADCAWQRYMREMGNTFKHYMIDMWCELEPDNLDSVNFLYLVLYVYQAALDKVSQEDAKEVVRNMWRGYRTDQETANDRIVLSELSGLRPGLKFKDLESIIKTI